MERREFVGSMLALFTGVAMPEPVRELVWVQDPWMPPNNLLISEDVLKRIYCEPIMAAFAPSQAEVNKIFAGAVEHWDTGGGRYVEMAHYFELGT